MGRRLKLPEIDMHTHDLSFWQHSHDFGTSTQRSAERRTRWVVGLTFATMLVDLAAGCLTGSMALLSDGWHMASRMGALGMADFDYRYARHHPGGASPKKSPRSRSIWCMRSCRMVTMPMSPLDSRRQ